MKQPTTTVIVTTCSMILFAILGGSGCAKVKTWKSGATTVTLDDGKTLTIRGNGAMMDYEENRYPPWHKVKDRVFSVFIEDGVTHIGNFAFSECDKMGFVSISSSVVSIGNWAFFGCSDLRSVTIPSNVTSIGRWAFLACRDLDSVEIPSGVTSICTGTFATCSRLTSVTIPEGVTSIGEMAFGPCRNLRSITIPSSVTLINSEVFRGSDNLTTIIVLNPVPPTTEGASVYTDGNGCVYVPESSVAAYRNAETWKDVKCIKSLSDASN
jgi:hypothetical protein